MFIRTGLINCFFFSRGRSDCHANTLYGFSIIIVKCFKHALAKTYISLHLQVTSGIPMNNVFLWLMI